MKVEEIMTRKIEYVHPTSTVYDAIEKMVDKRIRSLVVEPTSGDDVYGVITVRDIAFKVIGKKLDPTKVKVEEITAKPLVCVQKGLAIDHVLTMMEKFNIARIFICEDRKPVGVISLLDVVAGSLIDKAREGYGA